MGEEYIKAKAVMTFINNMCDAYLSGFVDDDADLTLAALYRTAQVHCQDTYGMEVPDLVSIYEEAALELGMPQEQYEKILEQNKEANQ